MTWRVGLFPHADLPHLIPCFRLGREIRKLGMDLRLLGSDVMAVGQGHSQAWGPHLARYGLQGLDIVHRTPATPLLDWLIHQVRELNLNLLVLDAVWQGLAYAFQDLTPPIRILVHHAGLPDFRNADMPTWRFVHPHHPTDHWARARQSIEQQESTTRGIRSLLSAIKAMSANGRNSPDCFEPGCSEFARLPALRAMSLPPAVEFPAERGRLEYLGTLLPRPGDVDWQPPPPEWVENPRPLILGAFGTTGLQTRDEFHWLFDVSLFLARSHPDCDVLSVIPDAFRPPQPPPANLRVLPWIPLWELLASRRGAKVLVAPPGVGAFREAIASATPIVAIPRRLDQFGAAARVAYFGIGHCLVSPELPPPPAVADSVNRLMHDNQVHQNARNLQQQVAAFDATLPLNRLLH